MNPGKIVAGLVDERVVGREHDVLCPDRVVLGVHRVRLHADGAGVLVDGHPGRQRLQKLQRVELRLAVKADRARTWKRQRARRDQRRGQRKAAGGGRLRLQRRHVPRGVQEGGPPLEVAGDVFPRDDALEFPDGRLVGAGVLLGPLAAELLDQPGVGASVLGSNLGGGAGGLAAPDPLGLQDDRVHALLRQLVGGQDARHAAADHGDVGFDVRAHLPALCSPRRGGGMRREVFQRAFRLVEFANLRDGTARKKVPGAFSRRERFGMRNGCAFSGWTRCPG